LLSILSTEEESLVSQQGVTSVITMDHFYKHFLEGQNKNFASTSERFPQSEIVTNTQCKSSSFKTDQSTCAVRDSSPSKDQPISPDSSPVSDTIIQPQSQEKSVKTMKMTVSQSIGTLCAALVQGHDGPMKVSGRIEEISDEEIMNNRETEEDIRNIPRFKNYQRGNPSNVSVDNSNIPALEMLQNVYKRALEMLQNVYKRNNELVRNLYNII